MHASDKKLPTKEPTPNKVNVRANRFTTADISWLGLTKFVIISPRYKENKG
jgi:hypothetical protein